MNRIMCFVYGSVCYVLFLGVFSYAACFVGDIIVPRTVDNAPQAATGKAIMVNVLLLSLFAIQHTIMARPAFKEWWTRLIPKEIERSTFVLFTCVLLSLMFWQWRSIPLVIWDVQTSALRVLLWSMFASGFGIVLISTFLIDHFDLFGMRQVYLHLRKIPYEHRPFSTPLFYNVIRHPLYLGFMIAFWSTPYMTAGHLLFAVVTTCYMLFGIQMEERDLVQILGQDYVDYRKRVPMILPLGRKKADAPAAASS